MKAARKIIVTGGAGYLGSCAAEWLSDQGIEPILLDRVTPTKSSSFPFIKVELCDEAATLAAFKKIGGAQGVLHFAALALVEESTKFPERYFRNNTLSTINVLQACLASSIESIVYSSSCSVYGVPESLPITEASILSPISPYGESKLMGEKIIQQYSKFKSLKSFCLRYFNPAGSLGTRAGEAHEPETHLIPNVLLKIQNNKPVYVFGGDYPTKDGSCVRDFIHVEDLVRAHYLALEHLESQKSGFFDVLNLGLGEGVSVREVIKCAESVVNKKATLEVLERREGDPPHLEADTTKACKLLGWEPKKSLKDMIEDHYKWSQSDKFKQ